MVGGAKDGSGREASSKDPEDVELFGRTVAQAGNFRSGNGKFNGSILNMGYSCSKAFQVRHSVVSIAPNQNKRSAREPLSR